ncbi:MAG TPA: ABC transporter ATP-binding protein [Candidatus Polarisedimenticolaceae bacterium]|nr:ABC transporter ATP-binding protein [Candidatus Polarisedimenticolaceae bacterium]
MLSLSGVRKSFDLGPSPVEVLSGVSFTIGAGEAMVVTGPSGSGKSTLLHLIGTLEQPSSGRIEIDGRDPFAATEPELARFRNANVGFVFQDHHLLPQYSVLENVLVPTLAFPRKDRAAGERARELLDRVGLAHRLDHRPAELSGGERQRVAVARALINRPRLLLCDEPTGSLDPRSAGSVAELLFELHGEESNVMIVVTHSLELASRFARRCELREGRCCER